MEIDKQKGQALLVVVLVMVVALTVGLSLASRSIINIRTSTEEADSQKALSAAEAGIEQSLQASAALTGTPVPIQADTTYKVNVAEVTGDTILVNGGNAVLQDDGIDIWLVPHNADGTPNYPVSSPTGWSGNLTFYWGDTSLSDCSNPALEIAIISGTKTLPVLTRNAYDPCASRRGSNNFYYVPDNIGPYPVEGKNFHYKVAINNIVSGLVARVVPIYSSTPIGASGSVALPSQGFIVDSTGTSGGGDREVKRSITFFKSYEQVPAPYFMYGLFAP